MPEKPIPVAKVPKITPVKEGQEYPVGRHNQLKLFHEHVWPKGYTPERMAEVRNTGIRIRPSAGTVRAHSVNKATELLGEHLKNGGRLPMASEMETAGAEAASKIANAYVFENIARSTIPSHDLNRIKDISVEVSEISEGEEEKLSHFKPATETIHLVVNPSDTAADIQSNVTHELGHAIDYAKTPRKFFTELTDMRNNPINYLYVNRAAPPEIEGTAEGFATAHSRITRGQKRTGGAETKYGYKPEGWFFPEKENAFREARSTAFKMATGHHYDPVEEPEQQTPVRDEHPRLPFTD